MFWGHDFAFRYRHWLIDEPFAIRLHVDPKYLQFKHTPRFISLLSLFTPFIHLIHTTQHSLFFLFLPSNSNLLVLRASLRHAATRPGRTRRFATRQPPAKLPTYPPGPNNPTPPINMPKHTHARRQKKKRHTPQESLGREQPFFTASFVTPKYSVTFAGLIFNGVLLNHIDGSRKKIRAEKTQCKKRLVKMVD